VEAEGHALREDHPGDGALREVERVEDHQLAALLALYDNQHSMHGLTLLPGLLLLSGSALLGWLGAWISVRQHLSAIEPR
jgi:hypothetical protein